MFNKADLSYIDKTESYIKQNKGNMEEEVFLFLQSCCKDERKIIQLAEEFSNQKGILKKPEAKLI
jgi:hypothetical protein